MVTLKDSVVKPFVASSAARSLCFGFALRHMEMNRMNEVAVKSALAPLLCLAALAACAPGGGHPAESQAGSATRTALEESGFQVYFGDLHNHSNLTYGHGSFENALENAAQSLDFFTVTPHALWPDIDQLQGNPELEWVIDYHRTAFVRLRDPRYWANYIEKLKQYNVPGVRITFPSFEIHSLKYGDHVVISKLQDMELPPAGTTVVELRDQVLDAENTIITPHGIGYQSGFRGYDWNYFKEGPQTPFVEIYSRHGGSEGSAGPFGMYHDMGPRDYGGTMEAGLRRGFRFGVVASSDSHAGHPGGFGDGRMAVLARALTRDDIWEAIRERRVYATTGANIRLDFRINGAHMGQAITDGETSRRVIEVAVEGMNQIDYVELVKNGATLHREHVSHTPRHDSGGGPVRAKVRFEFGWNQVSSTDRIDWQGRISLSGGRLLKATPQFRGAPFTSPQRDEGGHVIPWESWVSRITETTANSVAFHAMSESNPAPMHPTTQSITLDVEMKPNDRFIAEVNGQAFSHTLAELLEGSRSRFMRGWLTEAVSFNRAVPESGFMVSFELEDEASREEDYYSVRVRQTDHQWAWSSPIWVGAR